MISLKIAIRNVVRNNVKSLLMIVVSLALVVFLMYYIFLLNANNYKLDKTYDTTDVVVKVERRDSSSMKKIIPYIELKRIQTRSKLVGKAYYTHENLCIFNENGTTDFNEMYKIIATSDIEREIVVGEFKSNIEYADGYDKNIFANAEENVCIVSREILEKNNWKLGQKINIYAPRETIINLNIAEFVLAGVYDITMSSSNEAYNQPNYTNAVYCAIDPFSVTARTFYSTDKERWEQEFIISECEFVLKDSREVEKFKNYIKDKTSFYSEDPSNNLIKKITLIIYDDELKDIIGPVQSITNFMEKALPVIFVIIGTIAFGISYLMTQNRITDIALMRAMGFKASKIYNIIMNEMITLCIIGILLGLILCFTIYPQLFIIIPDASTIGSVILLYLLTYLVGSTIALLLILRLKPITVLTKKE